MGANLESLQIKNYRALADVTLSLGPVTVVFGANGAGKSSLLEAIRFAHDCAAQDVPFASARRGQGVGMLWDGAKADARISMTLTTTRLAYALRLGFSAGRIEQFPGACLSDTEHNRVLFERAVGATSLWWYPVESQTPEDDVLQVALRQPEELSLMQYWWASTQPAPGQRLIPSASQQRAIDDVQALRILLNDVRFYHCRSFELSRLKTHGSELDPGVTIDEPGHNLWSVLRNLNDRRDIDERYTTIMRFMRKAFPRFEGIVVAPTSPSTVYAHIRERGTSQLMPVSGAPDGYIQMLLLLAALFSEDAKQCKLLLLDEPEIALHPWALVVLAEAISSPAETGDKQVLLATHSPVLISQFQPEQLVVAEVRDRRASLRRVSEFDDLQDLLEEYAAGSLFMAGALAPQDPPEPDNDRGPEIES